MKVLVVTNGYPDFNDSYRGIFIQRLCKELKKQELDIVVLTPKVFKQSPLFEEDGGIKVYRFWYPSGNKPLGQSGKIPVFAMIVYMIMGLFKSLYIIIKERPDIIHGNWIVPTGLIAGITGLISRIPVVNTARGMDVRISQHGFIAPLFNLAVKLSNKIIVVSSAMKNEKYLKNAEVISSGVDEGFFEIPIKRKRPIVIYTRSFEPIYDVETLIKAIPLVLKKVSDARFFIAGGGSQESYLKRLVQGEGIEDQVKFLGMISEKEILALMKDSLVYVSTATEDGTSVSLLEAMAAGLIPVVTDIEANRTWVIHKKDGFLFRLKDADDLAENIVSALTGSIDDQILSEKRQQIKTKISWTSIAEQYRILYDHMPDK